MRAHHRGLVARRRQPARRAVHRVDVRVALRHCRDTPALQRHGCCAPPPSARCRTPAPAPLQPCASSSGPSRCRSSAHCSPLSSSITCTAAKSPSAPPPAVSTATMYSLPGIGGSHTCSALLRRRDRIGSGTSASRAQSRPPRSSSLPWPGSSSPHPPRTPASAARDSLPPAFGEIRSARASIHALAPAVCSSAVKSVTASATYASSIHQGKKCCTVPFVAARFHSS